MSNHEHKQLVVVEAKKPSRFARLGNKLAVISAGATAAFVASPAHAAILDLSELTTEMNSIKTAILGVIGVAVAIGIGIVGWRWAKRALFSI